MKSISIILILLLTCGIAFAKTNQDPTTEAYLRLPQREQVRVLQNAIDRYGAQGVRAKYTAIEYVEVIDNVMAKYPDYIGIPVGQIFKQILIAEGSLPDEKAKAPPGTFLTFLSFFAGGTLVILVLVALSGGALPQKIER